MNLSELSNEKKVELFETIKKKYPWCNSKENMKRLALIEARKLNYL